MDFSRFRSRDGCLGAVGLSALFGIQYEITSLRAGRDGVARGVSGSAAWVWKTVGFRLRGNDGVITI